MDRARKSNHLVWGASDHQEFEQWMEEHYPFEFAEWELFSGMFDLPEYIEREEYRIWESWTEELSNH